MKFILNGQPNLSNSKEGLKKNEHLGIDVFLVSLEKSDGHQSEKHFNLRALNTKFL